MALDEMGRVNAGQTVGLDSLDLQAMAEGKALQYQSEHRLNKSVKHIHYKRKQKQSAKERFNNLFKDK